jgi:acyl carrier protein
MKEPALDMDDTTSKLKQLIATLFKCEVSDLADTTGPGDIPGWDSLGHVTLMVEVQKQFGSHVPVEDAIEVESIADLAAILKRLQGIGV